MLTAPPTIGRGRCLHQTSERGAGSRLITSAPARRAGKDDDRSVAAFASASASASIPGVRLEVVVDVQLGLGEREEQARGVDAEDRLGPAGAAQVEEAVALHEELEPALLQDRVDQVLTGGDRGREI